MGSNQFKLTNSIKNLHIREQDLDAARNLSSTKACSDFTHALWVHLIYFLHMQLTLPGSLLTKAISPQLNVSLPFLSHGVCVCVCVEISFQMPSVFRESRQMWELESEPLLSLSLSLLHFNKLVTLPCSGSISEQNFQIHKRSMWIF